MEYLLSQPIEDCQLQRFKDAPVFQPEAVIPAVTVGAECEWNRVLAEIRIVNGYFYRIDGGAAIDACALYIEVFCLRRSDDRILREGIGEVVALLVKS